MQRTLYHGSESIITEPTYGFGNPNNDYGLGFYCSPDRKLAKEWASKKYGHGFANKYTIKDDNLNILDLTTDSYSVLNWISLLMHNRRIGKDLKKEYPRELAYLEEKYLIDLSGYDAVIGYRADDAYFKFPTAFIQSRITLESLDKIYLAGDLGKQFVLLSEKAFKLLKFKEAIETDESFKEAYYSRINEANTAYENLLIEDQYLNGTRLIDLVKDK